MTGISTFTFNGITTSNLGVIITKTPADLLPERDVEIVTIAGKHGGLIFDQGRYKNISRVYECAVLPGDGADYTSAVQAVCNMLRPAANYFRLEDSYQHDIFRMARAVGNLNMESIVSRAGIFTAEFDCKPQKFLKSGENVKSFLGASSLHNSTQYPASPIIRVFGNGPGEVSVGGVTVQIKELSDPLTLDCELLNAYTVDAAGGMTNKNAAIYAPKFPVLNPGNNGISWTGGVTRLDITPRWWTL